MKYFLFCLTFGVASINTAAAENGFYVGSSLISGQFSGSQDLDIIAIVPELGYTVDLSNSLFLEPSFGFVSLDVPVGTTEETARASLVSLLLGYKIPNSSDSLNFAPFVRIIDLNANLPLGSSISFDDEVYDYKMQGFGAGVIIENLFGNSDNLSLRINFDSLSGTEDGTGYSGSTQTDLGSGNASFQGWSVALNYKF